MIWEFNGWQSVTAVLGIGALLGGGIAALIGAKHRTRGSRRALAAEATNRAMELLEREPLQPNELLRLQAELFLFYFRVIKAAERDLFIFRLKNVISKYLPDALKKLPESKTGQGGL